MSSNWICNGSVNERCCRNLQLSITQNVIRESYWKLIPYFNKQLTIMVLICKWKRNEY